MENQITKSIKGILNQDTVKNRFNEILGQKAQGFISSVINVVNNNSMLQNAEPQSVLNAAVVAATLDLPIDQNLSFAAIVPFKDNKNGGIIKAQFQMMYKGFIQLALRSGQYNGINVAEIYEGELVSYDRITEEIIVDYSKKQSDKVVGYVGFFKLINGFEKKIYMSVEQLDKHGKRFSQTYKKGFGLWKDDFDSMCKKTVIKNIISKWGILSIEMQNAVKFDQSVINDIDNNEVEYCDNAEVIDDSQPIKAVSANNTEKPE